MKQTAVEWLVEQISYVTSEGVIISHHKDITELVEQAKEMEKEQYQCVLQEKIKLVLDTYGLKLLDSEGCLILKRK